MEFIYTMNEIFKGRHVVLRPIQDNFHKMQYFGLRLGIEASALQIQCSAMPTQLYGRFQELHDEFSIYSGYYGNQ